MACSDPWLLAATEAWRRNSKSARLSTLEPITPAAGLVHESQPGMAW